MTTEHPTGRYVKLIKGASVVQPAVEDASPQLGTVAGAHNGSGGACAVGSAHADISHIGP